MDNETKEELPLIPVRILNEYVYCPRPAIKGTLRFWWPALQWGKGVTDVSALKEKAFRILTGFR